MKLFSKKSSGQGRQRPPTSDDIQSSPSFSYHAARRSDQELNVGRQIQRESSKTASTSLKHFWLQRFGLVILLIAIIFSLVNILSLSAHAKIMSLPASNGGNSFLANQATYQAAADKLLAGSIWNGNKITINTASFSRKMQTEFPELSGVSVALPLLAHRPIVYLQPSQLVLILVASNGSFAIDTNGKALLRSSDLPTKFSAQLTRVTDRSGFDVRLNHQVLTSSDVDFIHTVTAQLAAKHVSVSSMDLPPSSSELDVHLSKLPYFVKFNLQNNDARQQAGTFLATVAQLHRQHISPAHYIDVRVDGRAYYR